jgi:MFS family permease
VYGDSSRIELKEIKKIIMSFKIQFYLLMALAAVDRFVIPAFSQNAIEFFEVKYKWDFKESGVIISVPEIIFAFLALFIGYFIDKRGKVGHLLITAYSLLVISHLYFLFEDPCTALKADRCNSGILSMLMIGFANIFISLGLYPIVNYLVKESQFGLAYSFLQVASNIGYLSGSVI